MVCFIFVFRIWIQWFVGWLVVSSTAFGFHSLLVLAVKAESLAGLLDAGLRGLGGLCLGGLSVSPVCYNVPFVCAIRATFNCVISISYIGHFCS